jgi:hypothetical protein
MLPLFGSLIVLIRSQNRFVMDFTTSIYDEKSIQTLEWHEHIRRRPGMYIGQLGNGAEPKDAIYTLEGDH